MFGGLSCTVPGHNSYCDFLVGLKLAYLILNHDLEGLADAIFLLAMDALAGHQVNDVVLSQIGLFVEVAFDSCHHPVELVEEAGLLGHIRVGVGTRILVRDLVSVGHPLAFDSLNDATDFLF